MNLTGRQSSPPFQTPTAWTFHFWDGTTEEVPVYGAYGPIVVRGNSSVYVVDDGGPGYSDTGGWTVVSGQGQEGDYRYRAKGNGSSKATWSFTGLSAGSYQVQTTWVPLSTNAKNSPFQVLDGTTLRGTASVNQQKAPLTTIYADSRGSTTIPWKTLGNFTITGNTLNVVLNNNANGNVQADMVRLVPISPTAVAAMVTSRDVRQRSVDAVIASHYFNNEDRENNLTLPDPLDRYTLRNLLRARRGR
jgi:hypothetical protein